MNPKSDGSYRSFWALGILLLVVGATAIAAGGSRKRGVSDQDPSLTGITKPQLLNADTNPTLRYPVVSFSGWSVLSASYGWLDVSRETVRYTVVTPPKKASEGFLLPFKELREVKLAQSHLTFRGLNKKYDVFYMAQASWGSIHSGPGAMSASVEGAVGTSSIRLALSDFDQVVATVKPPPAPVVVAQPVAPPAEPKPAAPPAPPVIMLATPSGASADRVVEVQESPLVVRGVAMDNTGIPVVSINGSPASMRPQSAQAAEFWSDPVTLKPGENHVEIVAANTAHVDAKLRFIVNYTPKAAPQNPRALGKPDIISLLQGSVPSARVAEIVKDRGIKFTPTAEDLNDLRTAGADDELIQAVQQAASAH